MDYYFHLNVFPMFNVELPETLYVENMDDSQKIQKKYIIKSSYFLKNSYGISIANRIVHGLFV